MNLSVFPGFLTSGRSLLLNKWALLFIILMITFGTYYPSLHNQFTNWDDTTLIVDNDAIKKLSFSSIKNFLTSPTLGHYLPLTMIVYTLEYFFFQDDPFYYHLTNVILHLIVTTLVFWLVVGLTRRYGLSFFVSILFGVHPLHVEPVAWIAGTSYLLGALFFFASLISYLKFSKTGSYNIHYYSSLIFLLLALSANRLAVTLPPLLFIFDFFLKREISRRIFWEKVPFFLSAILFGIVAILLAESKAINKPLYTFFETFLFASYGFITYI